MTPGYSNITRSVFDIEQTIIRIYSNTWTDDAMELAMVNPYVLTIVDREGIIGIEYLVYFEVSNNNIVIVSEIQTNVLQFARASYTIYRYVSTIFYRYHCSRRRRNFAAD